MPEHVPCRLPRSRSVVIVCSGRLLLLALVKLVGQQRERAVHDLGLGLGLGLG